MDRGGSTTIDGTGGLISLDWTGYLNDSDPRMWVTLGLGGRKL